MSTVYMIRCQGIGVIPDRVYLRPPTLEELKEALVTEVERHGLDGDGKPRVRWVMVQEAEAHGDESHEGVAFDPTVHTRKVEGMLDAETTARILQEKAEGAPPDTAVSDTPKTALHGSGAVTNPGDPGHVADTVEKAARMMRQAATERAEQERIASLDAAERERATIASDDVATLDQTPPKE